MSIRVEGAEALERRLNDMANIERLTKHMELACLVVETSAKIKVPKDTGALRRSIESRVENENGEIRGVIFTPLEYAPYIEYGTGLFAEKGGRQEVPWSYEDEKGQWHTTSGQKPQPFLRPALNENMKKISEILKEGIMND